MVSGRNFLPKKEFRFLISKRIAGAYQFTQAIWYPYFLSKSQMQRARLIKTGASGRMVRTRNQFPAKQLQENWKCGDMQPTE